MNPISDEEKRIRAYHYRIANSRFEMDPDQECEEPTCTEYACDIHHKDGDFTNNVKSNIEYLCRQCHMKKDGRLKALKRRMRGL
jgi:hypothetical protein